MFLFFLLGTTRAYEESGAYSSGYSTSSPPSSTVTSINSEWGEPPTPTPSCEASIDNDSSEVISRFNITRIKEMIMGLKDQVTAIVQLAQDIKSLMVEGCNITTFLKKVARVDESDYEGNQKIESIYENMIAISEGLSQAQKLSDISEIFNSTEITQIVEVFYGFLQQTDLTIEDVRNITTEVITEIKQMIPKINEGMDNVFGFNITEKLLEYAQPGVQSFAQEIPEEVRLIFNHTTTADQILGMVAQKLQEIMQNEAPVDKAVVANLFKFFYNQKDLFELPQVAEIVNAYGIQKQVDSLFALFDKFSYEGNLTIPFNQFLGSFSQPLEDVISQGSKLLAIIDNASKDLSSDERFKTIIAIADKLSEVKKLPRSIVEKLLENSIKAIENVANSIFNITDQAKPIIFDNAEPLMMKTIHVLCDFIKNNTISIDAYTQLYKIYIGMFNELIGKVQVNVPDFSALKEAIFNINQTILNIYDEDLAMSIYQSVSNLALEAYQTHFIFMYTTFNETSECIMNLYGAILQKIYSLDIIGKIKEFFVIGDAKGANYRSFFEAVIEVLADVETHWENYTAVFPSIFTEENRRYIKMVTEQIFAVKQHGLNVTQIITEYITQDTVQTEHIIKTLSATLFNQSASIMDIYHMIDEEFGIQDHIDGFKHIVKGRYQEFMVNVKDLTLELVHSINSYMNNARQTLDEIRENIQIVKQNVNLYYDVRKMILDKDTTLVSTILKVVELVGASPEQIEEITGIVNQVMQQFTQIGNRNIDISQYALLADYADMIKQYEDYIKMYTSAYLEYINNLTQFQFLISSETIQQFKENVGNTYDGIINVISATLGKKSDVINAAKNVVTLMNNNIDFFNQYINRFFETAKFENIRCEIPFIPEIPEFEFQDSSFFFNISEIKNIQAIINQINPNITSEEVDGYIQQIKETVIPFIQQINETVYNVSQETFEVSPEFVELVQNYEEKFNVVNEYLKMITEVNISDFVDQIVGKLVENATQILQYTTTDQLFEKLGTTRESVHTVLGEVLFNYETNIKGRLGNFTERFPEMMQKFDSIMFILNRANSQLTDPQSINSFLIHVLNVSEININEIIDPYVSQIKVILEEYTPMVKPYIVKYFEMVQPPLANVLSSLKTVNGSIFADVLEQCCGDFVKQYIEEIGQQCFNKTIDTNKTLLELFFNATGEIYNFASQAMPTNKDEAVAFVEQLKEMIAVYVPFFNASLDDYGMIVHESQVNATKELISFITMQKETDVEFIEQLKQNLSTIVIKDVYLQMVETPYIKIHSTIANFNSLTIFNVFTIAETVVFGEEMVPPSQRKALEQTSPLSQYLDMFKQYVEKIGDQSITINEFLPEVVYEVLVNTTTQANVVVDYYINNTVGVAVDYVKTGIEYANNYTEMVTGLNVTDSINYFIQINSTEKVDAFYEAVETKTKQVLTIINETDYVKDNIITPAQKYVSIIKPYTEMPVMNAIADVTETDLTNISKSSAIVFDKIVKGEIVQVDEIAAIFSNISVLIPTPEPTPSSSVVPSTPATGSSSPSSPATGGSSSISTKDPNEKTEAGSNPNDSKDGQIMGMAKTTFISVCVGVAAVVVVIVIVVVFMVIKRKKDEDDDDDDKYLDQSSDVVSETLL